MKLFSKTGTTILSSILLLGVSTASLAQNTPGFNNKIPESILTPDHVETPIGDLNFFDGMPDKATVQKLYDNLLFMRGVEAFLSGIPATSIEAIRLGNAEVWTGTLARRRGWPGHKRGDYQNENKPKYYIRPDHQCADLSDVAKRGARGGL